MPAVSDCPDLGYQPAIANFSYGSMRASRLANLGCRKRSLKSSGIEADLRQRRSRPRAVAHDRPLFRHSLIASPRTAE